MKMTDNYQVKTKEFSGPLEKLLELIEEHKLEITRLNLAEVTGDFLKYLRKFGGNFEPAVLADFVVVAAKLVLIKSKTLLPSLELTEEEESSIQDLELRLLIYQQFSAKGAFNVAVSNKTASQYVNDFWEASNVAYARPFLMSLRETSFFYPAPNLTSENLKTAMKNLVSALADLIPETTMVRAAIVTLEEKIKELLERCKVAVQESFKKLAHERSRSEVVVMFLAMLHLFREKIIEVEQKSQFGDIIIKKM